MTTRGQKSYVLLFGYVPSTDKRTGSLLRSGWPGLTGFVSLSAGLFSAVCALLPSVRCLNPQEWGRPSARQW